MKHHYNLQNNTIKRPQASLPAPGSLARAVLRGELEIARYLLERGASPNDRIGREVFGDDLKEQTALCLACANSKLEIVQLLLDSGADIHLTGPNGNTPLMSIARSSEGISEQMTLNNLAIAQFFLSKNIHINAQDEQGRTALSYAAERRNFNMVKLLVSSGALIGPQDRNGKNAFDYARGYLEIKSFLKPMLEEEQLKQQAAFEEKKSADLTAEKIKRLQELAQKYKFKPK